MLNKRHSGVRGAAALALLSAASSVVAVEQQPTPGLEEVVVTAQHVQENLQNVPIAVTAYSTAELQERNITDLSKLTEFVPNLNFLNSTGQSSSSAAFAFIRGIGQTNPFVNFDPGVGIYVDGIYIGRTQGAIFDVLDLQRVEVLRGPQGTLYGRNTIGGAVNLISNMPDAKLAVSGGVEGGNYGTINSHLKINVPLSDRVFASVAVAEQKHSGYAKAVVNSDCTTCTTRALSNQNDFAARAAVRWLATDRLTLDVMADYSTKDNLPIAIRMLSYNPGRLFPGAPNYETVITNSNAFAGFGPFGPIGSGPFPFPNFHGGYSPAHFVNGQYNTSQSQFAGEDRQQVWGTSVTATWKSDNLTFKSISAFRAMRINDSNDGDGSPLSLFSNMYDHIKQDQTSQEFQLLGTAGQLDWLTGLYGYKENATESQDFGIFQETSPIFPPGSPLPSGPFPASALGIPCFTWDPSMAPFFGCADQGAQYTNFSVASGAVYANGTYHFTDQFDVAAGLRYSYERKTVYYSQVGAPAEFTDTAAHWSSVIPRVVFEYHATKQALLYTSYSQGFKSGNFNTGNFVATGGSRSIAPEKVKSYEIGVKTSWLDDRLTANVALFYSDYTEQQLQVTNPSIPGAHAFVNAGASRIYGGEFELKARPSEYLQFDTSVGYTHSEITQVAPGTVDVRQGSEMPYSPQLSVAVGGQVTLPLGAVGATDLRADWSYIGPQNGDAANTQSLVTPGRTVTNFRATFRPASTEDWEIYAYVDNAFDREYRTSTYGNSPATFTVGIDGPPRTFGGGVNFRF